MLLKIIYLLVCPELGLFVLMFGADLVKDAELLVFRHEYAVLRRKARRTGTSRLTGCGSRRWRS